MEWWHCGPVVLAVILFLLVGTVIERQIETAFQRCPVTFGRCWRQQKRTQPRSESWSTTALSIQQHPCLPKSLSSAPRAGA
ncbi:uncharacterized protein isoform X2 [Choristoneura fumiferana]|uniref:uncharacterized protein isoform X2 n=1 Tax=Choristoneura fumiferana TaxID=7141 RepID=UPI003D157053